MSFKVGDQVRIRPDLSLGIAYGNLEANDGMCALKGSACTVSSQICDTYYKLEGCDYLWTEDMLEPDISVQNSELIKELNHAQYDKNTLHALNDEIGNSVNLMQDEFAQICKIIFDYGNKIKSLSENVSKITSTESKDEQPAEDEKEQERLKNVLEALRAYMNKK